MKLPVLRVDLSNSPARTICNDAEKHGHDLIVVGTHKRTGLKRLTMGSVAERVTRHASCSVLVVPEASVLCARDPSTIVAATDFSPASLLALDRARSSSVRHGARMIVANVVEAPSRFTMGIDSADGAPAYQPAADRAVGRIESVLLSRYGDDHGIFTAVAVSPNIREAVCKVAVDRHADLLVVGTTGRTGIDRWLMGSVAEHVVRHAESAVLVVR